MTHRRRFTDEIVGDEHEPRSVLFAPHVREQFRREDPISGGLSRGCPVTRKAEIERVTAFRQAARNLRTMTSGYGEST